MRTLLKLIFILSMALVAALYMFPASVQQTFGMTDLMAVQYGRYAAIAAFVAAILIILSSGGSSRTRVEAIADDLKERMDDFSDKSEEFSDIFHVGDAKLLQKVQKLAARASKLEGRLIKGTSYLALIGQNELSHVQEGIEDMENLLLRLNADGTPLTSMRDLTQACDKLEEGISAIEHQTAGFSLADIVQKVEQAQVRLNELSETMAKLPELKDKLDSMALKVAPLADNKLGARAVLQKIEISCDQVENDLSNIGTADFVEQAEELSTRIAASRHKIEQASRQLDALVRQGADLGSNATPLHAVG